MKDLAAVSLAAILLHCLLLTPAIAQGQSPDEAERHLNSGIGFYLKGNLEAASLELLETLTLDPMNEQAMVLLEKVREEQGWVRGQEEPVLPQLPEKLFSMNFKEADIHNVLRLLGEESGLNIVAGDVTGTVTVSFKNVTLQEALDSILKVNGYDYVREGNIIRIVRAGQAAVETSRHLFRLKHARAELLEPQLRQLLSPDGKMLMDKTSNTILIIDMPKVVEGIVKYIDSIDFLAQQVSIDTKIIETTLGDNEKLGINWNLAGRLTGAARPTIFPFDKFSDPTRERIFPENEASAAHSSTTNKVTVTSESFPVRSTVTPGEITKPDGTVDTYAVSTRSGRIGTFPFADVEDFVFGKLSFAEFFVVMEALTQRSDAKLVSNPKIMAKDNQKAHIFVGQTVPIPIYEVNEETGTLQVRDYQDQDVGVTLDVTPHISPDGYITLDVVPEVSSIVGFTGPNLERPITSRRVAQTTVTLRSGETMALGGLIKEDGTKTKREVPLLGKIPVLGWLFGHKSDQNTQTEMLVFITPMIVENPSDTVPEPKHSASTR